MKKIDFYCLLSLAFIYMEKSHLLLHHYHSSRLYRISIRSMNTTTTTVEEKRRRRRITVANFSICRCLYSRGASFSVVLDMTRILRSVFFFFSLSLIRPWLILCLTHACCAREKSNFFYIVFCSMLTNTTIVLPSYN